MSSMNDKLLWVIKVLMEQISRERNQETKTVNTYKRF